jgi:hypothetical protein
MSSKSPQPQSGIEREVDKSHELSEMLARPQQLNIYENNLPGFAEVNRILPAHKGSLGDMSSSINAAQAAILEYKDTSGQINTTSIVWKKITRSKHGLVAETEAYERLSEWPEIPILKPALAVTAENGDRSFATVVEKDLMSLESLIKVARQEYLSNAIDESNARETLLKKYEQYVVAGFLALLRIHQCNLEHGDAEPKNFGILTSTGIPITFDFEYGAAYNETTPLDPKKSIEEMRKFGDSMVYQALGGRNPTQRLPRDIERQFYEITEDIRQRAINLLSYDWEFSQYGWVAEKEEIAKQALGHKTLPGTSRIKKSQ